VRGRKVSPPRRCAFFPQRADLIFFPQMGKRKMRHLLDLGRRGKKETRRTRGLMGKEKGIDDFSYFKSWVGGEKKKMGKMPSSD